MTFGLHGNNDVLVNECVIQYHFNPFNWHENGFSGCLKNGVFMIQNYSLLLSGLVQRLLLAGVALFFLWGVYAWAAHEPEVPVSATMPTVEVAP